MNKNFNQGKSPDNYNASAIAFAISLAGFVAFILIYSLTQIIIH